MEFYKNYQTLFSFIFIITFIILIIFLLLRKTNKQKNKKVLIKENTTVAIFAAFSIILYLPIFRFSLPFFPSFLEISFNVLPIILATYLLGFDSGILVLLIKTVVMLPFSSSLFVGEICDLIIGSCICFVGNIIYSKKRNIKGAILSLVFVVITWIISAILTNLLISVPAYLYLFFGNDIDSFIGALSVIPGINVTNYLIKYIIYAVIPFNLIISVSICLITFFVYKKISILYNRQISKDLNRNE